MKLKAPEGVGEPCVAGFAITSTAGVYEVEPEVGALLIESFGFIEITTGAEPSSATVTRRGKPLARKAAQGS
jgi:hypothetical protein